MLPDIDMAWFHLVDGGQYHHHSYPTHWPITWIGIGLLGLALSRLADKASLAVATLGLVTGAIVHIALDTIAGHVLWLAPFSYEGFHLVDVPATHSNWVVSFLLHWTFGVELAVTAIAAWVVFSQVREGRRVAASRH